MAKFRSRCCEEGGGIETRCKLGETHWYDEGICYNMSLISCKLPRC